MLLLNLRLLVAAVLVLVLGLSTASADTAVVEGDPPLTQEMVDGTAQFYGWLLDAALTEEQLGQIHEDLVDSWQKNDRETIGTTAEILDLQRQLSPLSDGERSLVREQLLAELLPSWRQQPNDPGARWALGVYEAAHTPIAGADIPLTRQAADANAELVLFMAGVAVNGQPLLLDRETDRAFKDAWAENLVAVYNSGNVSAEQQREMAKMPLYWAAARTAWPALSPEDQEGYRVMWSEALRPELQADARPVGPQADVQPPTDGPRDLLSLMAKYDQEYRAGVAAGHGSTFTYRYGPETGSGTPSGGSKTGQELLDQVKRTSFQELNMLRWMGGRPTSVCIFSC